MRIRLLAVVVISVVLSGCATSRWEVDRTVGTHQPDMYKWGYADGCDSGHKAAGNPYYNFAKHVDNYINSAHYKAGWDDGFRLCR